MKHRHVGCWLVLCVFVTIGCTSQDTQQVAQGGESVASAPHQAPSTAVEPPPGQMPAPGPEVGTELPPLPPDPADWVCQDSVSIVTPAAIDSWCSTHANRGLPLPAALRNPPPLANLLAKDVFDVAFQAFIRDRLYDAVLGWTHDLNWRLTGPYVGTIGSGLSYGVHPAVRVYYSPEMIDWLCGDRTTTIPDGATIIKEMHPIDASLGITLDSKLGFGVHL